MKYEITKEKIELNYGFYKIIFFNDSSLRFVFTDNRKIIGNVSKQTGLMIYANDKKYEPWHGIIWHALFNKPSAMQVSGYIFNLDKIEKFLRDAHYQGYNVENILEEVLLAKQ
jgi:hypothetical protein